MSLPINVDLENVLPNPWQPRETDDPEKIRVLAESIAKNGLLQLPVGRLYRVEDHGLVMVDQVDELHNFGLLKAGIKVQLAFGHSRLAAFKYARVHGLAGTNGSRPGQWDQIQVVLRDLDDEDMFRLSVTENMARNDLNPIEVARSMERYRTEFGKTSEQIGELFGNMSDSAVRNKIRLLKLPEAVQLVLKKGELSEGSARALIPLYEVDEQIRNAAESSDELKPSEILEAAFSGMAPANVSGLVQRFIQGVDGKKKQPALPFGLEENKPGDLPEEYVYEQRIDDLDHELDNFLEGRDTFTSADMQKALSITYSEVMRIANALIVEGLYEMEEDGCTFNKVILRDLPEGDETLSNPKSLDDEITDFLKNNAGFFPGEMQRTLRLSYPAVWNIVKKLVDEGILEKSTDGRDYYRVVHPDSQPKTVMLTMTGQSIATDEHPNVFNFDEPGPEDAPAETSLQNALDKIPWEKSKIHIELVYFPVDDNPDGRLVVIRGWKNDVNAATEQMVCREVNLVLPQLLMDVFAKLAVV